MENSSCPACERYKATPRGEAEVKDLKIRLNRIIGQLSGISKMLDDNRYCGDSLTQIAASEAALQQVGYILLKSHMETCVAEDIKNGKQDTIEETIDLMRKLK